MGMSGTDFPVLDGRDCLPVRGGGLWGAPPSGDRHALETALY